MKQMSWMTIAMLAGAMSVLGSNGAVMIEPTKLEEMAKAARTAGEHFDVSAQYLLQAQDWETKAKRHEAEAKRLEAMPRPAIEYKWPAFSKQPWLAERSVAMQAKRAAKECKELAAKHERKSLELMARTSRAGGVASEGQ